VPGFARRSRQSSVVEFFEGPGRREAAGWQVIPGTTTSINAVLDVLEKRGVEFIENGVRLTKRPRR
jgi:hypothetical protein